MYVVGCSSPCYYVHILLRMYICIMFVRFRAHTRRQRRWQRPCRPIESTNSANDNRFCVVFAFVVSSVRPQMPTIPKYFNTPHKTQKRITHSAQNNDFQPINRSSRTHKLTHPRICHSFISGQLNLVAQIARCFQMVIVRSRARLEQMW